MLYSQHCEDFHWGTVTADEKFAIAVWLKVMRPMIVPIQKQREPVNCLVSTCFLYPIYRLDIIAELSIPKRQIKCKINIGS